MLLRLARGLSANGATNHVVSLGSHGTLGPEFESSGIPVSALRIAHPARLMSGLMTLRAIVRQFRPDIVQGWMYHANIACSIVSKMSASGVPLVWNIRRGLDDYTERKGSTKAIIRGSAWLSGQPNHIIFCSQKSREQHQQLGFASLNSSVIGNGAEIKDLNNTAEHRARIRRDFGVADTDIVVGNVGRFDVAKGHSYLLDAFARLAHRYPNVHLVCIGRGVVEHGRELLEQPHIHPFSDRIHLFPERTDILVAYSGFDLYCSSSIAEGFPNVIAEALASGVPVVATDTGATRDLVEGHGVVVPTRSSSDLSEGISVVLDESPQERQRRGAAGRQAVESTHSLDRVVRRYGDLYCRVVCDSKRGRRTPFSGAERRNFFGC